MGVVVIVLVILLAGTILITRIDFLATRRGVGSGETAGDGEEQLPGVVSSEGDPPPDVVAAISVALAMAEADAPARGTSLAASRGAAAGPSPWVTAARRRAMEGGARVRR